MIRTEKIARNIFLLILLGAILATMLSCTRKVYVPVETTKTIVDSTYIHRADSLKHLLSTRDSVIIRDSVVTFIHGDTVIKESWKVRDRISIVRDTIRINNSAEINKAHTDSISTPVIVEKEVIKEVERKAAWYETALMWIGVIAILVAIAFPLLKAWLKRQIPIS